jgi:AcrR family transcriptional regulator
MAKQTIRGKEMAFVYKARTVTPRLRPGPNGLPRGQVTEIQRSRILGAAVDAVEEVGYARMTVEQVISRARVSRKTFYEIFADREDCFRAAFEQALAQARLLASEAFARESGWREGIRSGLARLLMFMDEEPVLARLCVVEALAADGRVLERRARVLDELAEIIDHGRRSTNATREPPQVTAEGIVGGVFSVLHTRLLEDDRQPLTGLLGSLMSMIVLPYLGARAASRELDRPAPKIPRDLPPRQPASSKDPLEGLNMRLTYRTVQVLMVIAEHPGASNREIAKGSGIVDQGQISNLLTRLARLDLLENHGEGQKNGAANAWQLTARGAKLERATRPRLVNQ